MNVFKVPVQPTHDRYKVRGFADFDWTQKRLVRLEISVGQPYHEGAKLQAALEWANRHFDQTVLLLGDTLQRYNLMMDGVAAEQARKSAFDAGEQWLKRHAEYIKDLQIFRWDDVLQHPDFGIIRKKVGDLYQKDNHVKKMIDESIKEIAIRRHIESHRDVQFFDLSLQYLLEEITGAVIENQLYPGVSAYPGSIPKFWGVINYIVSGSNLKNQENLNCIRLRMKSC